MRTRTATRGAQLAAAMAASGLVAGLIADRIGMPAGIALAFIVVASSITVGIMAFRHTGSTITAVSGAASEIAGGHLGERVRTTSGVTGDLTRNFNAMAEFVQQLVGTTAAERARLEAVVEASSDAILAVASDSTVRLANRAATTLLGESRARVLGRPLIESARDHELEGLVRAVIRGRTPHTLVLQFGARRVPLQASAMPIVGGGEWAVLLVLTDLTEVQRFDQARRDFVSNVSHELRTPLASIKAMVETIEDGGATDPAERQAFLGRIHAEVDRLASLVSELLDLSRIESGALRLEPGPVDLAAALAEAADVVGPQAAAHRVTLVVPSDAPGEVVADRRVLVRILTNLLDNAVKFSPADTSVTVTVDRSDSEFSVAVRDQGPGIAREEIPRVFERFYKAEHSRSDPGTGLGLAIVKHLAHAHGGIVEVISEPGHGATFVVRLREQRAERAPTPRQPALG